MEYFVVYDFNDNILGYFDDIDELVSFTGLRKKQINYKFKNREFLFYLFNGSYNKIYRFFE